MRDNVATVINNIIANITPNKVYRYHEDTGDTGIHEKSIYRMLTAKLAKAIGGLSEGFIKIKISKSALDMINSRLTDMENTTYSDIG